MHIVTQEYLALDACSLTTDVVSLLFISSMAQQLRLLFVCLWNVFTVPRWFWRWSRRTWFASIAYARQAEICRLHILIRGVCNTGLCHCGSAHADAAVGASVAAQHV